MTGPHIRSQFRSRLHAAICQLTQCVQISVSLNEQLLEKTQRFDFEPKFSFEFEEWNVKFNDILSEK